MAFILFLKCWVVKVKSVFLYDGLKLFMGLFHGLDVQGWLVYVKAMHTSGVFTKILRNVTPLALPTSAPV